MRKKAILHLTGMKSTKYGGLECYFVELVRLCNKKGYNSIFQYELLPESSAYLFHLENLGATVVTFSTRGNLLRTLFRIVFLVNSIKPEIVLTHFVNHKIRFLIPIIAQIFGIRKTIAMARSVQNMKRDSVKKFVFNNYSHVLAVSNAIRNDLIRVGVNPRNIATLYHGVLGVRERSRQIRSQIREEFGIPEQAVTLSCIAFENPVKGVDILLNAFKEIFCSFKSIHLVVIGVESHSSELFNECSRLGLADNVHWVGIVDNAWKILNASDIYIQPSRSEGLGFAIIEAMSLKLPVVATKVGGIPEVVIDGETGYLADSADPSCLACSIQKMLAQHGKWEKFGEAGYLRYLRLFRGENSIKELVNKYLEL